MVIIHPGCLKREHAFAPPDNHCSPFFQIPSHLPPPLPPPFPLSKCTHTTGQQTKY